jgi:UDP-2-acetamido-2,6-beta-L-arabino-hexul-4-ose reductase
MIKVGITGQAGFIGTHLFNTFGLFTDKFERIPFQDDFFSDETALIDFVSKCDAIVHLAAMNRHNDPTVFDTNVGLVKKLIYALEVSGSLSHVVFASSVQEEQDSLFGKSKREGRKLLSEWAEIREALFTGILIPNVFGPFGLPYYNSVVATFCHQLTHQETPEIKIDKNLKLIYIGDLVAEICRIILLGISNNEYLIKQTSERKVSEVLAILQYFKTTYFENGIFPRLRNSMELNLFNTFRTYIPLKSFPIKLNMHLDERGFFVETLKTELGGQVSFSTTKPGITRGNHFHTRKIERFIVIRGKARIQLRQIGTNNIMDFYLSGNEPAYVDMPIWFSHNIANIGDEELLTVFWISEFFNPEEPDTFSEVV